MPKDLTLPFTKSAIEQIIQTYPTPFHIYDESRIRSFSKTLQSTFLEHGLNGYRNYFAVKALPNPEILAILQEEGMGFDCSSMAELLLCERIGAHQKTFADGFSRIMFTSNDTAADEYQKAIDLGALITIDDITHIDFIQENADHLPEYGVFRYNPGPSGNVSEENQNIIGNPEDAKFGVTKEQLFEGYKTLRDRGVTKFGLHTMVASNERNPQVFFETAKMLFELVAELSQTLGITFSYVNLGGGLGLNYKPDQDFIDLELVASGVRQNYEKYILGNNLPELAIFTENGRLITGPAGYLVTTVIHEKHIYKEYLGIDATMANLMRPALYGSYHHITILGKENLEPKFTYDVVGSLCENNDKFAIDRQLPKVEMGDILVIHDTGAHGHAMGFNYNGKLRSAELLLQPDGSVRLIRRAETYDDLFRTLVE